MIDDATSRLHARFVRHSTEENMRLLWSYLENNRRPICFYTDKASLFSTALKTTRDESHAAREPGGDAAYPDRASAPGIGDRVNSGGSNS